MKKLYSKSSSSSKGANKKRVHPSPPLSSSLLISFLPAAALALASTLSPDDQQVLAYLLACFDYKYDHPQYPHHHDTTNTSKSAENHSPELGCSCFGCYTSFWVRWDSSPNRHVIHAILDAYEESLETKEPTSMPKGKIKDRSKERRSEEKKQEGGVVVEAVGGKPDELYDHDDDGNGEEGEIHEEEEGSSSVMRFVSWVFGVNNN